jgi:potassium efflux system protein
MLHAAFSTVLVFVGSITVVHAQVAEEPAVTPVPTPTPQPTAIPATDIPNRAAAVGTLLRNAVASADISEELGPIETGFEKEKKHLGDLSEETNERIEADGPASVLEETQSAWLRSAGRLDGWMTRLKELSTAIADEKQQLEEGRRLWALTLASADEVEMPEALRQQVLDALEGIDAAETKVRASRDDVLTLQSAVAKEKAMADETMAGLKDEIALRRRSIVGLDSPPLWKIFSAPGLDGGPSEQLTTMWTKNSESIQNYVADQRNRLLRQGLFMVVLTITLIALRRWAALWAQQDRSLQSTVELLDRPLAAAFIVTMLLGGVFHPRAPGAWMDLMGLCILLALLRLLPGMLPTSMRLGAYLLALIYFLEQIADLAPDGNLVHRIALFAMSVTGAAACRWFFVKVKDGEMNLSEGWANIVVFGTRLAFLGLVAGAVGNLIGAVGLAILIVRGTLTAIYGAVLFWVTSKLLRAIVRVVLLTRTARKLAIVRLHADTVRASLFRLVRAVTVIGWSVMTLQGFDAIDPTIDGLKKAIDSKYAIGDFSVAPADILIFVIVVWLTFKISQLLRFILEADVMPHLDLPRGVPGAITRLTHYAIVVIGVMIGASAAGLDFSRINLIVGALGVGIGFGLQNVVNNFVSGLILLFERPIRVGDKVQLAELFGTVKDIGMRASIVRTFQGAEVIVPNANLISAEVVNWTLSDDRRRIELAVGVAYGTDPETVIEILVAVAKDHPEVMSDPEPAALFRGFGESSLDFQLRAWNRGDYVRVSSDLLVGINNALTDAGIEIPFPQRDLHVRSVEEGVAQKLLAPAAKD